MEMRLLCRSGSLSRCFVKFSRRLSSDAGIEYEETLGRYIKERKWKLIGANLFFRHGERTPTHIIEKLDNACFTSLYSVYESDRPVPRYPAVVYKEYEAFYEQVSKVQGASKKPTVLSPGQITVLGRHNTYTLGKKFRRRYHKEMKLIPEDAPHSMLYCRSTLLRRNLVSMRCFLSGLLNYRGEADDVREPMPLRTAKIRLDPFSYLKENPVSSYFKVNNFLYEYYPEIMDLKMEVVKELGLMKIQNSWNSAWIDEFPLSYIYDDLTSRLQHGVPLPDGVIKLLPRLGQYCTLDLCYRYMGPDSNWYDVGLQTAIGPAFHIILKNVARQLDREPETPCLRLYSTQDVFLIPFLITTGVFDGRWPPFCSYIALELYQAEDEKHWVQLHYNDQLMMELPYEEWKAHFERFATSEEEYKSLMGKVKRRTAA